MPGRLPPDDDPKFLARVQQIRKAPRGGDVVDPRRRAGPDEDERDEGPLAEDLERFSGVTRKCNECGKEVFDDSAVCYHCGHAFERTTAGSTRTKTWVIVTICVLVAAFVIAAMLGLL